MSSERRSLLVASTNSKKLLELQEFLSDLPVRIISLKDLPGYTEAEESGDTFEENARLKACGYAAQSGHLTLAEDSGLCVDALEGKPGVYSSRFSGIHATDETNNTLLLDMMKDIPESNRKAHYVSVMVLAEPGKVIGTVRGEVHGIIAFTPSGTNGFGYDPLFYYPPFGMTFGKTPPEKKAEVSHRAMAYLRARRMLEKYFKLDFPNERSAS